jgi:hypothetical protein
MARHRRVAECAPPELRIFRGDDWISDDVMPPLERWHRARFEWARDHPDDFSLGWGCLGYVA